MFITGLLTVGGCGSQQGPERLQVQGLVQLDGKPIPHGRITFIPKEQNAGPAASGVIADGRYSIPADAGAVVGRHRVEVESIPDPGFAIDDEAAYAKAHAERKGRVLPPNPIPAKYNQQSELRATVGKVGKNEFDFDLKSANSNVSLR